VEAAREPVVTRVPRTGAQDATEQRMTEKLLKLEGLWAYAAPLGEMPEHGGQRPARATQEDYTVVAPVSFSLALSINDAHALRAPQSAPPPLGIETHYRWI
jgi:hypothetical protein